jgi:hypothetical protein
MTRIDPNALRLAGAYQAAANRKPPHAIGADTVIEAGNIHRALGAGLRRRGQEAMQRHEQANA